MKGEPLAPTRPKGGRQADADARPARDPILDAVIDALTELDTAALTIHQVCTRAEVTPPTVYYHFGSKDGLIAAAVDAMVTQWIARLDQLVDRDAGLESTLEQATAAWRAMVTAPDRPFAVFVWVAMWEEACRPALVRARDHAHMLIRDGLLRHLGESPDLDDLSDLVLDGVIAAAVDYQLDGDRAGLDRRLATLARVIRSSSTGRPSL